MTDHNKTDSDNEAPSADDRKLSFEQAIDRLEQIVGQLEQGDVGLDQAIGSYEQGMRLASVCDALLKRAESKIEVLSGQDAQGNPITEPFDDESSKNLAEKKQTRSRRRTAKKAKKSTSKDADSPVSRGSDIDDTGRLF